MIDKTPTHRFTLADLAQRFGLELHGDGAQEVHSVGTLVSADPSQVSFLANPAYQKQLITTRAGAVILREDERENCPVNSLVAADPYLAYARIAALFDLRPATASGIHPSAVIDPEAQIGQDVAIGPNAVIGARTVIGDACTIGPGCVIAADVTIGEACHLGANVTLMDGIELGRRVTIHPGAVIGADGFGIAFAGDHWEKVPQLGSVVIGDDCEIGANTTIDRGALEDTVLEEDVRVDNLVQIAHNVRIGAHTAIAGATGIAGSARIGRYCLLGGSSGVSGHVEIADRVTVAACSTVFRSIKEPGGTWSGSIPARPIRDWQRSLAQLNRIDRLLDRIRRLENKNRKLSEHE